MHIVRIIAVAIAIALPPAADAAPMRALDGRQVTLTDPMQPTAVVFWSMDCRDCSTQLAELEHSGARVVVVNTDSANRLGALRPTLRRLGVRSPVVTDTDSALQLRHGIRDGLGVVVIAPGETAMPLLRQSGPTFASAAILGALDVHDQPLWLADNDASAVVP